ncbi:MAG: nuclear transport factor 2 family protein [Deltaproteobacteria bacterium]|nr:nuclear transport factor 2 family protein [Deltaproteobacteria bacterium]
MSNTNDNVELVKRAYAAFGRGDIPAILDMMTPDVTIGIVGRKEDAPFLGMSTGPAGVGEFFKQLGEAQEIHSFEPERFLGAEEKVFVWGGYHWTMRKSGVSKRSEWLHVLTVRDGRIAAWQGHNDTAMLAAAYHGSRG